MFAALTGFLYIAAGNSLIIHYSFFTIHYSFSEALCKGTTFRGQGGGALIQKGRWAALPPYPLAVFPLHSLSPNPQPSPGHRYAAFGSLLFAVTIVNFNSFLERASRSNFVDGNRAHTVRPYRDNAKQCRFCAKKLGRQTRPYIKLITKNE